MKLETSLKLLQPTTWACIARPCSGLPASTHRAISWSPASTGGESCGRIGPELVNPTPPLPWRHGNGSSAPVRVECEGGAAACLAGTLEVPSVQGHRLPPWQELWPYQSLFSSLL